MASRLNLALLLRNSLEFLSSLTGKSWHSNPKLLQQIPGIGQIGAVSLFNAGIRSIDSIRTTEESRLEVLLKRNPPFGRNLKKTINSQFPNVNFDCNLDDGIITVTLKSQSPLNPQVQVHLLIIAYSESASRVLLHHPTTLTSLHSQPLHKTIQIAHCPESSFSCSLMFEEWAGLNQNVCFDIPNKERVEKKETIVSGRTSYSEFEDVLDYSDLSDLDLANTTSVTVLSDRHLNPLHPNIPSPSISTSSSTFSKCKHSCKDKLKCAHICCKAGLMTSKRPLSPLPNPSMGKRSNCLASSKRSLTNAREYLRKYQPVNLIIPATSSLIPKTAATFDNTLYDEIEIALRYIWKHSFLLLT